MASIAGTPLGRIFMAGRDGNLYELDYQTSDSWWTSLTTRKVRKLNRSASPFSSLLPKWSLWYVVQLRGCSAFAQSNRAPVRGWSDDKLASVVVDNSRNLLYTLSDKSVIKVYDLGVDGSDMREAATFDSIVSDAASLNAGLHRAVRTVWPRWSVCF